MLTNTELFEDILIMTDLPFSLQSDHFIVLFSILYRIVELNKESVKTSLQVYNYAAGDWDKIWWPMFLSPAKLIGAV